MTATTIPAYFESILLIERLHRQFLEVVKRELDYQLIKDINNVQALILYNIGREEVTVGELTHRGYYLGSNVSYNVKKMVETDYLLQERSTHDKRAVHVRLSEKGLGLHGRLSSMFDGHLQALTESPLTSEHLEAANQTLHGLERFWREMLHFGPARHSQTKAAAGSF